MEERVCPCCHRHCSQEDLHCERGREYARTGTVPPNRHQAEAEKYTALDTDQKLLYQMQHISRILHRIAQGQDGQKRALLILAQEDGMTQKELTHRLEIQPGSASEMIAKLEAGGYVLRSRNESDQRTQKVSLTEKGKALAQQIREERQAQEKQWFETLSGEDKEKLLALLEGLHQDWRKKFGHGHPRHGEGMHCDPAEQAHEGRRGRHGHPHEKRGHHHEQGDREHPHHPHGHRSHPEERPEE